MGEQQKFSLIDFDGASDVINNFVDKLFSGAGWLINRETPSKTATNTYIEEIQKSNYDPLTKAALISQAKKTIKEYCNQKNIVEIAIEHLPKETNPEKMDDDWVALFMDKARLVSNKEFQTIWGKVLATECENNSIPKGLLYILSQMDKEDAETFTTLCSLSIRVGDEYQPLVNFRRFDEYKKWGITFDKIISLSALGVIETDLGPLATGYQIIGEKGKGPIKVHYFDLEYEMSDSKESVSVGNVIFTKSGQALCKAISVEKKEGFWEEYCLPFWKENIDS